MTLFRVKLRFVGCVLLILFALTNYGQAQEDKSNYKAEKELFRLNKEVQKKLADRDKVTEATYEEIISQFQALADKYPDWVVSPNLYFQIADLYRIQGKIERGIEVLKKIPEKFSENKLVALKALSVVATTHEKMGNYDLAIAQNREIIEKFAAESNIIAANAKFNIGRILEEKGDWENAIKEFEYIASNYTETPQALQVPIYIAYHFRKAGDVDRVKQAYQKAVGEYQSAIKKHPNTRLSIMAKQLLAEAYVGLGELDKARAILDELVELMPKSSSMHYNLARIHQTEKNPDKAIEELEKSLEYATVAKPAPPGAHLELVRLYLREKQGEKAVTLMQKEIEKNPENVIAFNLLGDVYQTLGKDEKAAEQFRKAIKINPKLPLSYNNLGLYNIRQKKLPEAAKNFSKAVELNPKYLLAQINLASVYEQQQDDKKAADVYRKILEVAPNNFAAMNNLAWLYAKDDKKLDEALDLALKAVALKPNDANVKDTLGWIHYNRGEFEKALENLLLSVKVIEKHPSIRFHLGVTYQKLGRLKEAQEELEKALSFNIDFPEKPETENALKQIKKK